VYELVCVSLPLCRLIACLSFLLRLIACLSFLQQEYPLEHGLGGSCLATGWMHPSTSACACTSSDSFLFLCCEKSKVYRGVESQNRGCVSNGKTDKQRVKTNKQTEQTSECRVVRHLTHLPSEGRTRLYRLKLILRASDSSALSSASP
jgi:hypothetical protein